MARPHPLRRLMKTPLPTIAEQKKKPYRPTLKEVRDTYNLINKYIFNNKLNRPPLKIGPWKNIWGMCIGGVYRTRTGSKCWIKLSDKYYCVQWFVVTLAHEMVHQYEWDILEKNMTHRQSFFEWRIVFDEFNIPLKTCYSTDLWFKYQNLDKL